MLFDDVTTEVTFKIRKWYCEAHHTYTVSVNGQHVFEEMDEDEIEKLTDEKIVYWYLRGTKHAPESERM